MKKELRIKIENTSIKIAKMFDQEHAFRIADDVLTELALFAYEMGKMSVPPLTKKNTI